MQRLTFPRHLYAVDAGNLAAYSPAEGKLSEFMPLPNINPANGAAHAAVELVHSSHAPSLACILSSAQQYRYSALPMLVRLCCETQTIHLHCVQLSTSLKYC